MLDFQPEWYVPDQNIGFQSPLFRAEVSIKEVPKTVKIRVVGLGHFHIWVNGQRLGSAAVNQPWSQYDKTIYYSEFDITRALNPGANCIGAMLGSSFWWLPPAPKGRYSKFDVYPDFSQGQHYLFGFDGYYQEANGAEGRIFQKLAWKWAPGPLTFTHNFGGEDYDAQLLEPGWNRAGFTSTNFNAARSGVAPKAVFKPIDWPTYRVKETFKPVKIIRIREDEWTYVFPQNCSGILRWTARGAKGASIKFVPSEVMTPAGEVKQMNLSGEFAWSYTFRGNSTERHEPFFAYHGFQYVKLVGGVPNGEPNPDNLPVIDSLEVLHTRTDNPITGDFTTSSDLFNRTHTIIDWAVKSNMSFVFTDCPHREKMGWLECSYLLGRVMLYRYDCEAWLRKISRDIADTQLPDGLVRTISPFVLNRSSDGDAFAFTVEWGAAGTLLPWELYLFTGRKATLQESYPMMKGYVESVRLRSPNGIAPGGLGDWYDYKAGLPPGPSKFTPTDLSATATYARCIKAVADAARVLGNKADADFYDKLFATVKEAFWKKFYRPDTGELENKGSVQAGHAMALECDLVPTPALRKQLFDKMIAELEKIGYQQTPGDIGHLYFIRALAHAGRSDVLYKVYTRTGLGTHAGILEKGLTTMPESWDATTQGGNSLNHAMIGHIQEWFYEYALGIRQAQGSAGWQNPVIGPVPGSLTSASGKVRTVRGLFEVKWTADSGTLTVDATVPGGVKAAFENPWPGGKITVNGKDVSEPVVLAAGKNQVVVRRP